MCGFVTCGSFLVTKQNKRCIALREKQVVLMLKEKDAAEVRHQRKTGEQGQRAKVIRKPELEKKTTFVDATKHEEK